MRFEIRYADPAKSDLSDIADYLEKEASDTVARAVLSRIRLQIRALETNALRYRERKELGEGHRAILIGPYIAFYRVDGDRAYLCP